MKFLKEKSFEIINGVYINLLNYIYKLMWFYSYGSLIVIYLYRTFSLSRASHSHNTSFKIKTLTYLGLIDSINLNHLLFGTLKVNFSFTP